MSKTYLVFSDTQMPYEDKRAMKAVINVVGWLQPDEVVHIGDLMDYPQPARWSKDTAAEFRGSVFADSEYGKRHFFEPLRKVYDGPVGVIEGNHDLRPREYLAKYAPALAESGAMNFETLLDFDGFGVEKLPEFYKFAPNWMMTHGHRGQFSLSRIAGNTALNAAKRSSRSVIMGHTHRLGIGSQTTGVDAEIGQSLTGMEVGNLMDMKAAHYLKGGTANWQQGFGLVTVEGSLVSARTVQISARKFEVHGEVFNV